MAESTLTLTYTNLLELVGHYLGYGRDSTGYNSQQTADCDKAVQAGYRKFLRTRQWSFLSPRSTVGTVSGTKDYDLADNFGSLRSDRMTILYSSASGAFPEVMQRPEGWIRNERSRASITGYPKYFAIRPKAFTEATGQRWEVLLWPDPDGAYTLEYRYNILRGALSSTNYPVGGEDHAETMELLCLAAAELRNTREVGPMAASAAEALTKSIENDSKMDSAVLGYNSDRSDGRHAVLQAANYSEYNGVIYGDNAP